MKIALMSKEFINNDIDFNCEQIISSIKMLAGKADLICFGEAFLQGFDSLSWKYKIDANIALAIDSKPIKRIRKIANEHKIAVAFGYLEKDIDKIYCSYIFIGNDGEIVNNYRRVSKGWKEYSITDEHYCEGKMLNGFNYLDKKFVVALCGDLWYEENILAINNI